MAEWMEELRRLDELRADSLITDEEYDKQKALLIPSENSNEKSYNLLNKNNKPLKVQDDKEEKNLVNRIKKIFLLDD